MLFFDDFTRTNFGRLVPAAFEGTGLLAAGATETVSTPFIIDGLTIVFGSAVVQKPFKLLHVQVGDVVLFDVASTAGFRARAVRVRRDDLLRVTVRNEGHEPRQVRGMLEGVDLEELP